MDTIQPYAYWSKWLPFSLNNEEFIELRPICNLGQKKPLPLAAIHSAFPLVVYFSAVASPPQNITWK